VDASSRTARDAIEREIQLLLAATVHDLRTPLAALSGEVELALRRERSPGAYREILARIADRANELIELTADLAFLSDSRDGDVRASHPVAIDACLQRLSSRAAVHRDVAIDEARSGVLVVGDEALLDRGLTLLVEHAVRHRRPDSIVGLRWMPPADAAPTPEWFDFVVAASAGFLPGTWQHLQPRGANGMEGVSASGLLRLRTAVRMVENCGGSISVITAVESESVRIRLRRA
jgi:signal transduction histidine kinase